MKLIQPDSCEIVTPKEIDLIRVIRRMPSEDAIFVLGLIGKIGERNTHENSRINHLRLVVGGAE